MVVKMTARSSRASRWLGRGGSAFLLLCAAWTAPCVATTTVASAPVAPLTVALDDNYPPYIFRDASGALNGYLVDVWQLWESKTGVPVELLGSDWDQAQARMQTHQARVIDTIFQTPEREKTLTFTPPYAQIPVAIYTHAGIGGITGPASLRGFLVGVKAGDACIDTLQQAGVTMLQPYPSYEALVQAAMAGQVRIFCLDEPPANYLLYKNNAEALFKKAFQLGSGEFHRAVRLGDVATLALLNRGFAAISDAEMQALHDKWMGHRLTLSPYVPYLAYALLAGSLLGAVLLLWGTLLRRSVRQRTTELEAERARLRVLLEAIPDLVWMKDGAGVYRFCNPMFERFFGARESEIVGKTDYDFVDKALADFFRAHDLNAIEAGQPSINEEWITFADDGHRALLETTKTPVRDAQGVLMGVLGVARDITGRKQIQQALQESESRLHTILDSVEAFIYIKDRNYRYQYANKSVRELYGKPMEEIAGREDADFFDAKTAANLRINDRCVIEHGERVALEEVNTNSRNAVTSAYLTVKLPLRDKDGHVYALCGISTDITEHKKVESSLRIAAASFESQEGMLITDASNIILRINQSFAEMSGYSVQEVVGQMPSMFASGRHGADFYAAMWASIHTSGSWQGEIWDRRKNGEIYPKWMTITAVKGSDGAVTNYVATHTDITERKAAEAQISHLAFYDPLTLLPNRRLLADRLQQALAASARSGRDGALLFIDLDHFKTLNDTLGHDKGDLLLQEVARRLAGCVREGDTVARLGGDEFVVMLEDLSAQRHEAASQTETVGEKILTALRRPFDLNGNAYSTSSSIGITLFDAPHNRIDELMKRADLAMYQAKAAGRNTWRFFDPAMQAEVSARAALEVDLRAGLQQGQLVLYYQPQLDAAGCVTGAESLVRWQHPQRGLVSPAEFIPLAEATGLILPLGHWVLETACRQLAQWASDPARAALCVAVNVSAGQMHQRDFVEQVLAVLAVSGANPKRLKLELTESLLLDDVEGTIAKMQRLKALGVTFSLDDFGTGYSSLTYLKRLPLEQLKIDQSFVRDVLTDPNDAAIARTVVALAHSLGLAVIAEGVETEAQRDWLASQGCHAYQGYLFSRPLPIAAFEAFMQRAGGRF
jgi:diguanylate cyclase (GGDEF)-like protein/PAS domain S-box-containing protein